jgi:cytochrome d ubiquinol oxidase subunit II
MGTLWFWIVALMLAAYVVLDGFDLGVGIVYPFVAKTEQERRDALRSIGPVWDGNEVWLLAAGGTLFFAFPLLYASAFSGFYLPLMIVLWLLILRGISIELRSHSNEPLMHTFFDALFFISSMLLAVFFGAALANVVRGVPIGKDDYFFLPLWTDWLTGPSPGILDWYTVTGGVLALLALALHGSLYLALKTEGDIEQRALRCAGNLWPAVLALTLLSIPATVIARPNSLENYRTHLIFFLAPLAVLASLATVRVSIRKRAVVTAFTGSCLYIAGMLVGAAAGLFAINVDVMEIVP